MNLLLRRVYGTSSRIKANNLSNILRPTKTIKHLRIHKTTLFSLHMMAYSSHSFPSRMPPALAPMNH